MFHKYSPISLAILSICLFLPNTVALTNQDVQKYAVSTLALQKVPGAAIAVVRKGKVLDEIIYGSANLQLDVPVSRQTRFQLASVTKVFSIIALLQLEQAGKLNLEDPVSKYLSDLPPSWRGVTLRELATHTSGLPDIIDSPNKPLSKEELSRSGEQWSDSPSTAGDTPSEPGAPRAVWIGIRWPN